MRAFSAHKKRTGKRPHEPLVKRWGHLKVVDIGRRDVRQLLDAIAERAPIMANRVLACVRKLFNYAIKTDWPLLESNPCTQIEAPGIERRRDRVLSAEEIRTLWTEAVKERPPISTLFRLAMLTAQRNGELLQMTWDQVDLESGWWTIPSDISKTKLAHRVPLTAPALAMLHERRAQADGSRWVFPSPKVNDQPIAHAQKAIERIRARSHVDFRGHDLRRTAASS
jgi:integrase